MENILKAININAGYGTRQVLWNVNLSVKKGEKILLIGPNGSGKSTLLKVITGIVKPYSGQVIFKGEDITHLPTSLRISRGISYLPQTRNIFPSLTVNENFHIACYYCENGYFLKRRDWVLDIFPFLKERLNMRAGLLSGGQRQALAVGMALMREAELLIIDEPTAGLSPKAAREILRGIDRAQFELKFTIIMVEHNLKLLPKWFTRSIIMREGRIYSEETDITKLLDSKILDKVYFG